MKEPTESMYPLSVMLGKLLLILPLVTVLGTAACSQEQTAKQGSSEQRDGEVSADAYDALVQKAIDSLVSGDAGAFERLLSRELVATTERTRGEGAVDRVIHDRFIPFFEDFESLDERVSTTTTKDAYGNKGLAFFRSFLTKDGVQKPFVLYILEEKGRLVVGNVLVNTTMNDVLGSASNATNGSSK